MPGTFRFAKVDLTDLYGEVPECEIPVAPASVGSGA